MPKKKPPPPTPTSFEPPPPQPRLTSPLNIRLTPQQRHAVDAEAARLTINASDLVRLALNQYFWRVKTKLKGKQ